MSLFLSRIKFFFNKPILVRCSTCDLKVMCLGGPKCIHPDKGTSWGMSGYLVLVSAMSTAILPVIFYTSFTPQITATKYFLMTWLSGSLWTLLTYHCVQWYRRKKRREIDTLIVMAQMQVHQAAQQALRKLKYKPK